MIGAIADDFTGGTDVAVAFRRAGLRTVMLFSEPVADLELPDHDAVVIALKTRTIDSGDAVRQSLNAATWLRARGTTQLYFKYCSTFDSRPEGNIGPVVDALANLLDAPRVAFVPSSPEHRRTQYMGDLFVGAELLAESPMRYHPLTPMTDSFVPRLLEIQTQESVALIDHFEVRKGSDHLRTQLDAALSNGSRYIVIDAISETDLAQIGEACVDDTLVTGAAGLAGGLGAAHYARLSADVRLPLEDSAVDPIGSAAASAVLAGSCSSRTLEQVAHMRQDHDSYRLDALAFPDSQVLADAALAWYETRTGYAAPLIYSSLPPAQLHEVQDALGIERASAILETAMGYIAQGLVARGVRRIVVAGGETSGAVVTALDIGSGVIGDEAAPGVPWIYTPGGDPIALLLKSGNFGDVTFLARTVDAEHVKEAAA